ncbi:yjeF C-terminal region, hydroxyethylthiazole kinase-related/yjeF N-terminal region [Salegentibacter echinorum]|uniref:Bifunctional NAD(P)H-hydrate repair enzyme n=1 Tax=Salegentibacter echinorum TaxID=1073325 RepID=A0A1M5CDX4_SALEC|nr:bifunctional ADP-dependent NAD(P)H-hydrate dehydratase/NAD(P)H-hydrate epimerase [Salegentibacter echinorum]SHF52943.1 yjeF C-terminal region, hydroxyethylthiazole kinase-related/yjeF N-terminal region [Salegentibacter echinorum]
MKILSAEQLNEADKITLENEHISSTRLMERAASLVFNEIHTRLEGADIKIKIFCGIGNNGGDGLVIGRLLHKYGYNVEVFIVDYSDKRSDDFLINYDRYKKESSSWPEVIEENTDFPEISPGEFVVDAIFGIGLNRPAKGWLAKLLKHINNSGAFTLAVDMPSGLFPNKAPQKDATIIKANYTLSFQNPKLTFFLPETMNFIGELQILDIGLDRDFLKEVKAVAQLIGKREARQLYRPRKRNSHKGDYGHTLVVGGSYGKIGSIVLSAKAVLRSGAGLCSVYTPKCGYQILQTALPEAMVITDKAEKELSEIKPGLEPDVVCFGMGAGKSQTTANAFKALLEETEKPMLIDADGLNMISENMDFLNALPKNSILTPHPKELERLIGSWEDDFEKMEKVKDFSKTNDLILVLKGSHSFVFSEGNMYINNSGNPGMATAGSGDVLSGIIAGLMSQKYEPLVAAILGVYMHGLAGDICAEEMGVETLISGDLCDYLGQAFLALEKE